MENWEIVRVFASEEEAILAAGFLRAAGIPAEVESRAAAELPVPANEDFGDYRVLVHADRLSEALTLLAERDAAPRAQPAPEPGTAPAEPGAPVEEPSPVIPE